MEKRLVANKRELIESSLRFASLANSNFPAEQKLFASKIKNIKRFVAIPQPGKGYIFAPGAYVAYHDVASLEEWDELCTPENRHKGRNHLDKMLRSNLIDDGNPLYEELKSAYEIFCGDIEPSTGDTRSPCSAL